MMSLIVMVMVITVLMFVAKVKTDPKYNISYIARVMNDSVFTTRIIASLFTIMSVL